MSYDEDAFGAEARRQPFPEAPRIIHGKEQGRRYANGHDRDAERGASGAIKTGAIDMLEKVDWAWRGWLAYGKLHILGGQKGVAKSTIAFDWLAQITVGGAWPDGSPAPLGDVLIWSGEDDFNDTILPRVYAAGGDVKRVRWPGVVTTVGGVKRSFDPALDVEVLRELARQLPELRAILIDPIVMASTADSHRNAETRRGLQPLVDLAVELNIILIGITHFTKGTEGRDPIERITGTLAFGAIPRVVMAAARGETEDGPRKLVRIGSNIGPTGGGFEYLLFQQPLPGLDFTGQRILWGKPLTGTPLELLGDTKTQSQKLLAAKFLDDQLGGGMAVKVNDLKAAAIAHSVSWPTVERAKKAVGNIIAERDGKGWAWRRNIVGTPDV